MQLYYNFIFRACCICNYDYIYKKRQIIDSSSIVSLYYLLYTCFYLCIKYIFYFYVSVILQIKNVGSAICATI